MDQPKKHIAKAHDHFFRMMMSDKRVAHEFFAAHLSKDVLTLVDLDQLELQPTSFIDDLRKEAIADMLFKTMIAGHEAYLYLLVDHQSRPDELMPFRILKYLCNIIDQHLKDTNTKRIPLILPMVVYHGRQPWNYSNNINELVNAPRELVETYFLKPFALIDLNQIEDEVIKQNAWSGVMELTLKYIFARDMLPYLNDIINLLKHLEYADTNKNFIENVLIYILDRGELSNKNTFIELIKTNLTPEVGDKIMTIAEQFKTEGIHEGVQKAGIVLAKLNQGMDIKSISKETGLSIEEIESLKKFLPSH